MRVLGAVGILTLLIVCANVANLMLARSVARQREMAVRRALGAPHARIMRLLFSEGLALSLTAAAAAWLFAQWATRAIVKLIPPLASGARIEPDLAPDSAVALYALALAALSALAFTAAPAIRAWRQEVLPWLKAGEHGVVAGRSALANLLAGAQLALCVVLLTGAGLASRSLYLIGTADLHFKKDHLLLLNINTSGAAQARAAEYRAAGAAAAQGGGSARRDRGIVCERRAASEFRWMGRDRTSAGLRANRQRGWHGCGAAVSRNTRGLSRSRPRHFRGGRDCGKKDSVDRSPSGGDALAGGIAARTHRHGVRRAGGSDRRDGGRRDGDDAGRESELCVPAGTERRQSGRARLVCALRRR